MKVFVIGYPGEMGGANTEAWHTVKLWRRFGADVHLIPTWGADERWRRRLDALGCPTHAIRPEELESVPGLAGTPVVSFCNAEFIAHAHRFRRLGCPIVWANCMTFLFDHEKRFFAEHGPADAMVYQSDFQRSQIEPQLVPLGYQPGSGHLIRGAFDVEAWQFRQRPHAKGEVFVVGRVARPDQDKWSSNTWPIYNRIQYANKRALMLGMDERTHQKLGSTTPDNTRTKRATAGGWSPSPGGSTRWARSGMPARPWRRPTPKGSSWPTMMTSTCHTGSARRPRP